jgi:hypothetical protein
MDESTALIVFSVARLAMVACLFLLGYYGARRLETRYGPGSAKLPPVAWGFLFLLCLLPALIAALIVSSQAKRDFKRRQMDYPAGRTGLPPLTPLTPPHVPTDQYAPAPPTSGRGAVPGQTILPGQ